MLDEFWNYIVRMLYCGFTPESFALDAQASRTFIVAFLLNFAIYFFGFAIFEMLIHELIHYGFAKKYGIKVVLFKLGVFNLAQLINNNIKFVLGIPAIRAECRVLGEFGDETDSPEALYYVKRRPYERLVNAAGAPLLTFLLFTLILIYYFIINSQLNWLTLCFIFGAITELANLLIPIKIGRQKNDALVTFEAIFQCLACFLRRCTQKPRTS